MERKVEIISQELIKPIISQTYESYTFSSLDQLSPQVHVQYLLYYPQFDQQSTNLSTNISLQLKNSLSKILVDFYPFGGRIMSCNNSISCCNNEDEMGVVFIEAFAHNYKLQDILSNHGETKIANHFIPKLEYNSPASNTIPLLVQLTLLECGGMILGCSVSHKVADATSFCTFLKCWANATNLALGNKSFSLIRPDFTTGKKIFPPNKLLAFSSMPLTISPSTLTQQPQLSHVSKVFVFDASSIANLKADIASTDVPNPTRVEAVSALIWKCATKSSSSSSSSLVSYLLHAVNLRKWSIPTSSTDKIMGNFIAFYWANKGENDKDLSKLVAIQRRSLSQFHNTCTKNFTSTPILENWKMCHDLITRSDIELYSFSSWCGMPFYDVDFGWGKPVWFSTMEFEDKNFTVLMDSKDGGVEAWICLEAKHMEKFEKDPDLLKFVTNQIQ